MFKCSVCTFAAKKTKTLYNHSRYTHMGPTLFCDKCGYTTLKSYDMRTRIEPVHLRIRYNCELYVNIKPSTNSDYPDM